MKAQLIIPAMIAAIAGGCSSWQPPYDAGIESRLLTNYTAADQEIIELVAASLIVDSEFIPNAPKSDRYDSIILSDRTVEFLPTRFQCLERSEGRKISAEAKQSLFHRNKASVSIDNAGPKNSAILVEKVSRELQQMLEVPDHLSGRMPRGVVSVSLPGYSKDGNSAVICIGFVWSKHGASGVFYLDRFDGAWRIKSRWFEYYC